MEQPVQLKFDGEIFVRHWHKNLGPWESGDNLVPRGLKKIRWTLMRFVEKEKGYLEKKEEK